MIDVKEYNPSFSKVYRFMERHINANSEQDFQKCITDFGQFTDKFEIEMASAVLNQIIRLYGGDVDGHTKAQ